LYKWEIKQKGERYAFASICALKEQIDYNTRGVGDNPPKMVPIKAMVQDFGDYGK
jgi:hypothetical protein